jgi:protocatechuate 3,4-dioxygenase beta subunit
VVEAGARTRPEDITAAALASFEDCPDERLRELLQALTRCLHDFAREVGLTQEEWAAAIATLVETGRMTQGGRDEFVLWSDTLGLSMLVDALAHPKPPGATESTIIGPFWAEGAPLREYGEAIFEDAAGEPALVHGRVLGLDGEPVAGAEIDVWQNDADELYAVQRADGPEDHLRGRFRTREDGSYAFVGVRPVVYPIPADGPAGRMLAAAGRHPWRPAHLHMTVTAPGYERLTTHFFDAETDYLDSDAVFAVKPSLVREFVRRSADDPDRPPMVEGDWWSCENDIVLVPAAAGH